MSHGHDATTKTRAPDTRLRFSVLRADADDAEVHDFIQRLTESDEEYSQRQQTDHPDTASVEPAPVDPSH